ncbi:MAG: hypothetical protein OXH79_23200 [Boseongicola sp.]|nr:hypothetical protein [Boseongicola sp.]
MTTSAWLGPDGRVSDGLCIAEMFRACICAGACGDGSGLNANVAGPRGLPDVFELAGTRHPERLERWRFQGGLAEGEAHASSIEAWLFRIWERERRDTISLNCAGHGRLRGGK